MNIEEIRDLEGPNLFLLEPAIKIEISTTVDDLTAEEIGRVEARLEPLGLSDEGGEGGSGELGALLGEAIDALHRRVGVAPPETVWTELDTPGHMAVAFGWSRRRFALHLAKVVAEQIGPASVDLSNEIDRLRSMMLEEPSDDDLPLMVSDVDRRCPIVGITGTNGKTTTTRLTSHILTGTGRRVGWSSSTGVFIQGKLVLGGDYTGPAGARRVLDDPNVDIAVLETARGGILLRGLAYESNDVGVFLNVTSDHLGLHGVHDIEGLAKVKSTVVKVTRPNGYAVLNADDPNVRGVASTPRASLFWFTQHPENPTVSAHVESGGRALVVEDEQIVEYDGGQRTPIVAVADVPITFGGRASHMLENALAAAAACRALNVSIEDVREGLQSFDSSAEQNDGRLNVYDLDGVTVILDFAHNESGLTNLLSLASSFTGEGGRVISIIGTAGDRMDEHLRSLGRIASDKSDQIIIKETTKYLRGRSSQEEMTNLFVEGIAAVGDTPFEVSAGELESIDLALTQAKPGDVVAMMCIEEGPQVRDRLLERGATPSK